MRKHSKWHDADHGGGVFWKEGSLALSKGQMSSQKLKASKIRKVSFSRGAAWELRSPLRQAEDAL